MENELIHGSESYKCPFCNSVSQQKWMDAKTISELSFTIMRHLFFEYRTSIENYEEKIISLFFEGISQSYKTHMNNSFPQSLSIATCSNCKEITIWKNKNIVHPKTVPIPPPNKDLGKDIIKLYHEASTIFIESPKGATALLRLALQMLLKQLGKEGKNINNDIKELVQNGLSPTIQQAFDLVRVVGNNAVHPGQIDLDDNKEIAYKLFLLLNFIANEMITKPLDIALLYNNTIPSTLKEEIKKRDKK